MATPKPTKVRPVLAQARKVRSFARWSLAVEPVFGTTDENTSLTCSVEGTSARVFVGDGDGAGGGGGVVVVLVW